VSELIAELSVLHKTGFAAHRRRKTAP
jgi:hypothetical protein